MYKEILYEIIDKAIIEDTVTADLYIKLNEKLSRMNEFSCWRIVSEHTASNETLSLISEDKYAELLKGALKARGVPKAKVLDIMASRAKMLRVRQGAIDAAKGIRRV
jgi:hypothetical protein